MVAYLGRNASVFLILTLLIGCAGDIQRKEKDRALALGVGHFREKVVVKDDSLEQVATFDTSNGFVKKRPLLSGEMKEEYLRGFLDKKTRKQNYQVYVVMLHQSVDWYRPTHANFCSPLQTTKTKRTYSKKSCKDSRYTGKCFYHEEVVFPVSGAELRRVQKAYAAQGASAIWPFRLKTKSGKDYTASIPSAEVAALLKTMDAHKPVPVR